MLDRNTEANGMSLHGKIHQSKSKGMYYLSIASPETHWHPSKILDRQHILSIDKASPATIHTTALVKHYL